MITQIWAFLRRLSAAMSAATSRKRSSPNKPLSTQRIPQARSKQLKGGFIGLGTMALNMPPTVQKGIQNNGHTVPIVFECP